MPISEDAGMKWCEMSQAFCASAPCKQSCVKLRVAKIVTGFPAGGWICLNCFKVNSKW
jgi:hypothetical protein